MILLYNVKVQRHVSSTTSPTGDVKTTLSTIYDSLACDLQDNDGTIVVPAEGQTSVSYKTMFCKIVDIKSNDIVTDLSSGEKMKVIDANIYTILKHMEIKLESGTS